MNSDREKDLLDLFIHPGWKLVMAEMEEAHDVLVATCHTLDTMELFNRRKGEIQKLRELITYESVVKLQMEEDETV